jgi:signal transduction histidine kinase
LRKIVPENQQLIKRKNLSLSIFIQDREVKDGDAFWVQGEELLCHTMLSNLVKNAVEAAPENSPIDISLQEDENYQIKIHNFGVVPEKIRDRFFEKYVTAGKKNGTGLGAYSAQLIARTHGGDISLSSSEESGTTLTVSFPKNYACLN